jgi:LPXTG-site transpeptidase (sortase) family protein
LTGTINPPSTAGISLTSGTQQAPPAALKFTLPSATILPGQVVTATATWTATGVTPPATVYLVLNFKGEVEGIYPPYDITTAPMPILVNPEPAIAGTTVDGLALDPNATEPVITKSSSVPSAFPGEEVAWTITITNLWTQEMASVALTDAVPGDLVVQSASTTAGASIVNENLVDVTTGPLQPGQRVTVTILTTVSETAIIPGIVTNVACGAREEGTEVCAEAVLALGPGGPLPPAGIGSPVSSLQSHILLSDRAPFALAIFGLFFGMLMVNMNNRQRAMLAVLALVVVIALVGIVLILSGGEGGETPERPSQLDGSPPPQAFNTATPIPTEVAKQVTSTPEPTVAPDVLATLASFPATATPYIPPTPAGPRRLDIPVLNYTIPLPIVELPQINGEWDVTNLGHNIGWLDNTTWLDPTWGNTVMVGHIQLSETDPGPFHDLDKLVPGDEIHVLEGSNISVYKVTDIFTVNPTDNTVTHPTEDPTLTLITCTNWSDDRGVFADRLVVQAVPAGDFGG